MRFTRTCSVDITLIELEHLLCSQAQELIKDELGVDSFEQLGVLSNDDGIRLFTLDLK